MNTTLTTRPVIDSSSPVRNIKKKSPFIKSEKSDTANPVATAKNADFDHRPAWQIKAGCIFCRPDDKNPNVEIAELVSFDKTSTAENPVILVGTTGILINPKEVDITNCSEMEIAAYCCYMDACMRRDGMPIPTFGSFTRMKVYQSMYESNFEKNPLTTAYAENRKYNWKEIMTSVSKLLLDVKDYEQYLDGKKILDWWEKEKIL